MRQVASRYNTQKPALTKTQKRAKTQHLSIPSQGLSVEATTAIADAKLAGVLTNFYVDEDRITARSGYIKLATMPGGQAIGRLIPHYGVTDRLAAATNGTLCDAETGTVWKTGFTGNRWEWTSFSNLGEADYTVMCNGLDGVWAWDGTPDAAGFAKQAITAPTGNTWLDVDRFHVVLSHMNRLWFADDANLAIWYLPLQQKEGALEVVPLNAIFKRGGTIRAIATWSVDGGMGQDDQLVIFTTNGECAIYSGVDPDTDLGLVGVYRIEPPMSPSSVVNYGGELYVLIPTGVTPMTSMLQAGKEGLEMVDTHVLPLFLQSSIAYRGQSGWELFLNPSSGRLFANIPKGGGRYDQMIRHMPKPVWSKFEDVPAHTWAWLNPFVFFGDDKGNVYKMHPQYRTDDGAPIRVAVQMAWNQFKTANPKQFKMLMTYIVTDGNPCPFVGVKVNYRTDDITSQSDELSSENNFDTLWDTATWDVDYWTPEARNWQNWQGVTGLGRVGAVSLSAQISDCSFAVTGWDVLWEEGVIFG